MPSLLAATPGLAAGNQLPRYYSVPPYASSSGQEAVDLALLAGLDLDPWQQLVLRESLGESADWKCSKCTYRARKPLPCLQHPHDRLIHPWTAFEIGLVVARQNGKSEILVARMLAGAFLLGEQLQIYSAHQFDTAMEVFHRLVAVVENAPELVRKVRLNRGKVGTYSHGSEGITLKSGARIRFKARTSGGGRGFSCDNLMLDEAMILPEAFLGTTIPTLSARANPQIWLAGSAVDQTVHEYGVVLAKRRERGMTGTDRTLAYFEWSAAGEDPEQVDRDALDDPAVWAQANPGLGIRIAEEYIGGERVAMGIRNFAVERLGIGDWPDTSDEAGRVIPSSWWKPLACNDESQSIEGVRTFAVDVNPDRTHGAITVAGLRPDEDWHLAVVDHREGTDWIVARCVELKTAFGRARFVVDKNGPAGTLLAEMKRKRVRVIEASAAEYAQACQEFYDSVKDQTVRYPDPQPELSDALAGAKQGTMGDAWKWSRKNSTSSDITPLVAGSLALWAAKRRKREKPGAKSLAEALANASSQAEQEPATPPPFSKFNP